MKTTRKQILRRRLVRQRSHYIHSKNPITRAVAAAILERELLAEWIALFPVT